MNFPTWLLSLAMRLLSCPSDVQTHVWWIWKCQPVIFSALYPHPLSLSFHYSVIFLPCFCPNNYSISYCPWVRKKRYLILIFLKRLFNHQFCDYSVQFSRSVVSDSWQPHEWQHTKPPCPSPTPGVHSDSRPSSRWCHPAISFSVVPFSSCP